MLDAYESGELDTIHLVYNEFVNTMTQKPMIEKLVPIASDLDKPRGFAVIGKAETLAKTRHLGHVRTFSNVRVWGAMHKAF